MTCVAPGVQGELLIGGPGIASGYVGRPDLTAEKFIANPFSSEGNDPVLYRSGDAVTIDEAGRIVFQGRIDDQVKIRGFRVELGEIENILADLPGIAQAAVVLRNDDGLDRLVAFLVPRTRNSAGLAATEAGAARARACLYGAGAFRDRHGVSDSRGVGQNRPESPRGGPAERGHHGSGTG